METMNFSINVPAVPGMNIDYLKQKIQDYVRQLINVELKSQSICKKDEMAEALKFIDSLEIPGAKNASFEDVCRSSCSRM